MLRSDVAAVPLVTTWRDTVRSIPLPLWALGLVSALAYFHNLNIALFEGSEGLYAHIAREMVQTQHYLQLTYQGEPYANKTPLYFWLLAFSTTLLGDSEFALRFPAALFSVGTVGPHLLPGEVALLSPRRVLGGPCGREQSCVPLVWPSRPV